LGSDTEEDSGPSDGDEPIVPTKAPRKKPTKKKSKVEGGGATDPLSDIATATKALSHLNFKYDLPFKPQPIRGLVGIFSGIGRKILAGLFDYRTRFQSTMISIEPNQIGDQMVKDDQRALYALRTTMVHQNPVQVRVRMSESEVILLPLGFTITYRRLAERESVIYFELYQHLTQPQNYTLANNSEEAFLRMAKSLIGGAAFNIHRYSDNAIYQNTLLLAYKKIVHMGLDYQGFSFPVQPQDTSSNTGTAYQRSNSLAWQGQLLEFSTGALPILTLALGARSVYLWGVTPSVERTLTQTQTAPGLLSALLICAWEKLFPSRTVESSMGSRSLWVGGCLQTFGRWMWMLTHPFAAGLPPPTTTSPDDVSFYTYIVRRLREGRHQ
jgi:hypothetical protein